MKNIDDDSDFFQIVEDSEKLNIENIEIDLSEDLKKKWHKELDDFNKVWNEEMENWVIRNKKTE